MNYFLMFFITSVLGTIITVSTNSWWVGWLGMEMNLLGFMILLMNNNSNESSLKYFIVQSLSSVMLMSSTLLMENFTMKNLQLVISLSLLLKLGAAPLHFWLPLIVENITKYQMMFLLTWQKLAPLYLLFSLPNLNMTTMFIMSSLIMGAISSINELRLFTLITFSSMNHTGWILLSLLSNELMSMLYILMYTMIIFSMLLPFNNKNNQTVWLLKNSYKYIMLMNMLSLAGLPPFAGFIMKWMLLTEIYNLVNMLINLTLMMTSMFLLYFYLRMIMNSFFKNVFYMVAFNKITTENAMAFSVVNLLSFYMLLLYVSSM